MYGYRARIGYTSPPLLTEVFPYEFYKVVPEGVTLVLTTLRIREYNPEEVQQSFEISMRAAREMARAGVNIVVLGGSPINISQGLDKVEEIIAGLEQECGIPISTSLTAKMHALQRLGARKVGVIHHFSNARGEHLPFRRYLEYFGFEVVGLKGMAAEDELGLIPADIPRQLARELVREHPEIDTLYFPSPHWPVSGSIEAIEQELGVNVVGSLQGIVWEALRRCTIPDPIFGYGRLLREF